MANQYGPRIVTDGLVFYVDAGNSKSYAGSGTAWNDLSGNNINGTLTNGPTYSSTNSGSIVFDGVDDYVVFTASSIVTSVATFIVWLKRNGNQGQYDGILLSRGTSVTGMNFYTNNQLGYHWNNTSNTYAWSSTLTVPDLEWCMCVVSVAGPNSTLYLCRSNSITTSTLTYTHGSTTIDDINIGRDEYTGTGRVFSGNIAAGLIYNRALSASEVSQNFNATKGRFGL